MSSETVEPVIAPELPSLPASAGARINNAVKTVIYWSFIGLGCLIPPLLGIYGTFF